LVLFEADVLGSRMSQHSYANSLLVTTTSRPNYLTAIIRYIARRMRRDLM
jgi:hypothetical protein